MYEIFSQALSHAGNATAIILTNKEKLSYKHANEIVLAWAKYFSSLGIVASDRVALLTEYEDLHPFIYLALDLINASFVPLDTDIPRAQLEMDVSILGLKKIVIDKGLGQRFSLPDNILIYAPESSLFPITDTSFDEIALLTKERDPAIASYIVASSGTTQYKKWIPIGSAGLHYWAGVEKELLGLSSQDKILCTRSPAYDARISEYLRSFAAAATLVLMSRTERRDFEAILNNCEKEGITCLILIASQLAIPSLDVLIKRLALAGLKHLMVTGDTCTLRLKQLCEESNIHLWNCYGPTEATFGMSILRVNGVQAQDESGQDLVPIGFPHGEQVKCHIVQDCLYIESPFLSQGYINNPFQTENNFPTLNIEERWIRVFNTQDKVILKDGKLILKGRINQDAHCKVSGVKVEPHTIEQCIQNYNHELGEDVLEVCVVVKPWLDHLKPVAYIKTQKEFSLSHLLNYLKKWLRKEDIPLLLSLDEFPYLIPSGKIDKRALQERKDHPDEFLLNEGKRSKQKFSGTGQGVAPELIQELNVLAVEVHSDVLAFMEDEKLFECIDRLVLNASLLDRALNPVQDLKPTIVNWLQAAFDLFKLQRPQYYSLVEKDGRFNEIPIAALSSIAQLLHYYGRCIRYRFDEHLHRQHYLRKAILIADYLEKQSSDEDKHAFQARSLFYNLTLMYCIRDNGELLKAVELAQQQSQYALEKQDFFMLIQFKSYAAEMLLTLNQQQLAIQSAEQALEFSIQFYKYRVVYFNAVGAYLQCCLKMGQNAKACELGLDILEAYHRNPNCGVKPRHIEIANKALNRFDALTKIWGETLGLQQSEQDQEFIFVGGDSNNLQILYSKIRKTINSNYQFHELAGLEELTLRQIRASLQNRKQANYNKALVKPLTSVNSKRINYFFLPPLLGESYFTYQALAKIFAHHYSCNIYGLSDPNLYEEGPLPQSLEEFAERYVKTIKKVQPTGPYYLFGFSFGATLAYEVAKQLIAEGNEIKNLHLVDAFPPKLYQSLPFKEHAILLQDVVVFMVETLNNSFYKENIQSILLINDGIPAVEQIHQAFDWLLENVRNKPSQLLLILARQHALSMLNAKEPTKLPIWAKLYLSTPNQAYLQVVESIPIHKKSSQRQSFFWNRYFEALNLTHKRPEVQHLQLLKPRETGLANSAHLFWAKAHDPATDRQLDYLALKPFYVMEFFENKTVHCRLFSLNWRTVAHCKKVLATWPVSHLSDNPFYEHISQKYNNKDRLFTTKYSLSFLTSCDRLAELQELLSEQKIDPLIILSNEKEGTRKETFALQNQNQLNSFIIRVNFYWNNAYLMTLSFDCKSESEALLQSIFSSLRMQMHRSSNQEMHYYNFKFQMRNIQEPSVFNALSQISAWLNIFTSLLIEQIPTSTIKQNSLDDKILPDAVRYF